MSERDSKEKAQKRGFKKGMGLEKQKKKKAQANNVNKDKRK